ncbi:hypothetical protein ACOMHN_065996 [Nucella lapillus]
MELGILHNSQPSTKRGCRAGRLHRLWHGLPPAPWPCTRSQHHSVPSRNLHPLMVPPFLQPHPDLQSAVGNAPLSSKHPAQLPTTDCLLSIISPMGGQPSDAPALSPPSPLQQGGQSSNAPALSPPSPLPQGGQPIALALSPPSPPPQGGQPSDAPGLSPSSSTLLLCPSDSTLNICHLNSQSAVKTGTPLKEGRNPWREGYREKLIARLDKEEEEEGGEEGGDYCSIVQQTPPFENNTHLLLELIDTTIFDYLTGNADRHHFDVIAHAHQGMMVMLDNGKRVRQLTWQRLRLLRGGILSGVLREVLREEPLHPVLTDQHLQALDRRLNKILTEIQSCLQRFGEDHVLV